ncbi:replication initiator [Amycolatopsis saalfeldensis]|uniref:Replication initiation protein n=1 Tax=Amycolatopsis saalfeldensis TaxID=394193 RepID=A0A1H8YM28_9PSEU|nr:replication initiator [Amycolatopsis saalfeldensis]SEP52448.1 hypothetical protein SAMN04489732_120111 [Amycolatopsis saalfeldensis]
MWTLDERISHRLTAPGYAQWRARVFSVGGCARPITLHGTTIIRDTATGLVRHSVSGRIFTPCGNRRSRVCPTCSDRYAGDAFHIVRAGLAGGPKGVPASVTGHPRMFLTLTAPSFGAVHSNRGLSARGRRIPCRCRDHHPDDDPRLGTPIDPESYDYEGAVLWQAHAGMLWARFTTRLRRELAKAGGLRVGDFAGHGRLSFGKVAEFQKRGLVHFHAVVRIDGPDGPADPPPPWASDDLLDHAVRSAAAAVVLTITRPDGTRLQVRWGAQLDIRRIAARSVEDGDGTISEHRLAAYIAKYATKDTGAATLGTDRPVRSERHIDYLRVSPHHRRIIATAWRLGGLAAYERLNLRHWAHMLGFRGHFLTKSRCYSTTFRAIRDDQRGYRLAEFLDRLGITDPGEVAVINDWTFTGAGYRDDAESELAAGIAARIRSRRHPT